MGISGLLPLLKSVQRPTRLSELGGKTVAVDAYVWLHKGAYACAAEIVTGKPTTKYVDYAMRRIRLLQHYNIKPYIVFDGGALPAKKRTELQRKKKRDENLKLADSLAKEGKQKQAREHYTKCVDISPQVAYQLIKALRAEGIPYIVAPYEADAQLFYLESIGLVDAILTEDSDLLIFGAKHLLLKLDPLTATCITIKSDSLASNSSADFPLHGWGLKELRECAMLSGCDYLNGVHGIGLKTASKYLRKWGTLERALKAIRMDGKSVEKDWEQRMRKAEAGFLHQRVWDPVKEEIVYLTSPDLSDWSSEKDQFVGPHIETELARKLVSGDVDPTTLEPMIDIVPSFQPSLVASRPRPLAFVDNNVPDTCRKVTMPTKGSLLQYFTKQTKDTNICRLQSTATPLEQMSGKRTLAAEYERDRTPKRLKLAECDTYETIEILSKFFSNPNSLEPVHTALDDDKENLEQLEDLDEDIDDPTGMEFQDGVTVQQEEGYISPVFSSPEYFVSSSNLERPITPDFSSPLQCKQKVDISGKIATGSQFVSHCNGGTEDMALANPTSPSGSSDGRITSPPAVPSTPRRRRHSTSDVLRIDTAQVLISETVENVPPLEYSQMDCAKQTDLTLDLEDIFLESSDTTEEGVSTSCVRPPIRSPDSNDYLDSPNAEDKIGTCHKLIATGWEKKFSFAHSLAKLKPKINKETSSLRRRRETLVEPRILHPLRNKPRRSLPESSRSNIPDFHTPSGPCLGDTDDIDEVTDHLTSPCANNTVQAIAKPVLAKSISTSKLQAFRFK